MPDLLAGQGGRDVALGVPGRGQHQRYRDQLPRARTPARARGGATSQGGHSLAQRRRGQLDEAARHRDAIGRGQPADPGGQPAEGVHAGLVPGAVRGQEQREASDRQGRGRGHAPAPAASPAACLLAIRSRALNAATATAEPPFSETLVSAGIPLARSSSLAVAAPTKPTGTPMTRAGSTSRLMISVSAVGAQPTIQIAPGPASPCATRTAAALVVIPTV